MLVALYVLALACSAFGDFLVANSQTYTGQFRRVEPGERHAAVLVTWSHTEKRLAPTSREDGLRRLGSALEAIKAEKGSDVELESCKFAVFLEPHMSGRPHLHIACEFPSKSTLPSHIGEYLLRENVCVDVRAFAGGKGAGGAMPILARMLNYCAVPTEEKWLVDTAPLLYNLEIPVKIADAADKAARRLAKKPASLDDLYNFLSGRPDIRTPTALDALLNAEIAKQGEHKHYHLPYTRLRLLASKLGQAFPAEFAAQYNRLLALAVGGDVPYATFFKQACSSACVCSGPGRLCSLLRSGVSFHDEKEYYGPLAEYKSSREHLGAYYSCLVGDCFPARQQCLVLCGEMGSGKTAVAQQHLRIYPSDGTHDFQRAFVFKPALGDTFPFTGIPPMAKFVDFNDFRTTLDGIPPSTLLNLAEHAPCKVPQKGGSPVTVTSRVVISANYIAPGGQWKREDIDALLGAKGRTFGGPITWKHPLQTHSHCGDCRRCSADFMTWCMEGAAKSPERSPKKKRTENEEASDAPPSPAWAGFDEP